MNKVSNGNEKLFWLIWQLISHPLPVVNKPRVAGRRRRIAPATARVCVCCVDLYCVSVSCRVKVKSTDCQGWCNIEKVMEHAVGQHVTPPRGKSLRSISTLKVLALHVSSLLLVTRLLALW